MTTPPESAFGADQTAHVATEATRDGRSAAGEDLEPLLAIIAHLLRGSDPEPSAADSRSAARRQQSCRPPLFRRAAARFVGWGRRARSSTLTLRAHRRAS